MAFDDYSLGQIWSADAPQLVTGIIRDQSMSQPIQWLNYFWKERSAINAGDPQARAAQRALRDQMLAFFNTFFECPAELATGRTRLGTSAWANRGQAQQFIGTRSLAPARGFAAQSVFDLLVASQRVHPSFRAAETQLGVALAHLLHSGFVPVAKTDDIGITGEPELAYLDRFQQAWYSGVRNSANVVLQIIRACNQRFAATRLGWRGDARDYEEIRRAGGLFCKAASEAYAAPRHMRRPWHPFADRDVRNYLYYRTKSTDNCLHTVVSISTMESDADYDSQFKVNAAFPQLEELSDQARASRTAVKVRRRGQRAETSVQCFVDDVTLYLCEYPAGTPYFDTQQFQTRFSGVAGFPERAVRGIPADNILGYVKFVRVHHGQTNAEGFTALPVLDRSKRIDRARGVPANVKRAHDAACAGRFSGAWAAAGFQPAAGQGVWADPAAVTITRVGPMQVGADGRIAKWQKY